MPLSRTIDTVLHVYVHKAHSGKGSNRTPPIMAFHRQARIWTATTWIKEGESHSKTNNLYHANFIVHIYEKLPLVPTAIAITSYWTNIFEYKLRYLVFLWVTLQIPHDISNHINTCLLSIFLHLTTQMVLSATTGKIQIYAKRVKAILLIPLDKVSHLSKVKSFIGTRPCRRKCRMDGWPSSSQPI